MFIKGCYECAFKVSESRRFVCVKSCEWRVGLNSYCNTMNTNHVTNIPNLYEQSDHQIYVCKGDLVCIDFSCQCPRGKKFVKDRNRCIWWKPLWKCLFLLLFLPTSFGVDLFLLDKHNISRNGDFHTTRCYNFLNNNLFYLVYRFYIVIYFIENDFFSLSIFCSKTNK